MAEGAPTIRIGNNMAALNQAGVAGGVAVDRLLHHVLQPLEPGCLAEAILELVLGVGALLEDVVEAGLLLVTQRGVLVPERLAP